MVKAIIDISQKTNRVINVVKAKYDLRDKSQAINKMAEEFEEFVLEPELRPEFIEKLRRIEKEGTISQEEFERKFKIKL
jgi:uncharacterized coiled-coil DUF342 family protein